MTKIEQLKEELEKPELLTNEERISIKMLYNNLI